MRAMPPGGVMDAVAFASVLAQDVPPLHAREGVRDAGASPFVDGVELVLPDQQPAAVARPPKGIMPCRFPWYPASAITCAPRHARSAPESQ